MEWMHAFDPALGTIDVQAPMAQIDLRPTQLTEFLGAQAMTIRKQDRCTIT
jgi:hypothetical protein